MWISRRILMSTWLLCWALGQAAVAKDTLVFSSIESSVNTDISERVLRAAYQRLGFDIHVVRMPAARAIRLAASGTVDGELYRVAGLERAFPSLKRINSAVNLLEGAIFSNRPEPVLSLSHINDKRIGIRKGVIFSRNVTEGMQTVELNSNIQLFGMLEKGRVDLVIMARTNGLGLIRQQGLRDIFVVKQDLVVQPLFHYLHERHEALIAPLTQVLVDMHEEGIVAEERSRALASLIQ